jgi:hypothetical protein
MRRKWLFLVLGTLAAGGLLAAAPADRAPDVPDVAIVSPDPTLPKEVKALSGTWVGRWNSVFGWDYRFHVEEVNGDTARVVQSWGEYSHSKKPSCHCDPGWQRVSSAKVTYADGEATIDFETTPLRPSGGMNPHEVSGSIDHSKPRQTFSFTLSKDEPALMKGHFVSGGARQLRIEMKKVDQAG